MKWEKEKSIIIAKLFWSSTQNIFDCKLLEWWCHIRSVYFILFHFDYRSQCIQRFCGVTLVINEFQLYKRESCYLQKHARSINGSEIKMPRWHFLPVTFKSWLIYYDYFILQMTSDYTQRWSLFWFHVICYSYSTGTLRIYL